MAAYKLSSMDDTSTHSLRTSYSGLLATSDENFDNVGTQPFGTVLQVDYGSWRFSSTVATEMAVADQSSGLGAWLIYDSDDPNDGAMLLNYGGTPNVRSFAMGSADGSEFKLESLKIGQFLNSATMLTITGYRNGVAMTIAELVNLAASDSAGNITYTNIVNDGDGRYGTLTFNGTGAFNDVDEIRFQFSGDSDLQIDDIDISTAIPDTTPPVFASAAVNGTQLVMSYTEANLLSAAQPATGAFTVLAGGVAVAVSSVAVDQAARTVTLTLASAVQGGQAVTVAYADPTAGDDANAIQDVTGNDAASLPATAVTNNTPDTTPPVFASATVNGSQLVMTYTEITTLDAGHPPLVGSFAVRADGSPVTVSSVAVDANAKTVTLTLASAVGSGQAVTVAYTDPTAGNDVNAIQDAAGNDAATLAATAVTNNTLDTTAPIVGSLDLPVNGSYRAGQALDFTVTFNENVTVTGTGSTLGLQIGSTNHTAAYLSKTANAITYRYIVQAGDNDADGIALGTLALNGSTIRDAAGNNADLSLSGAGSTAGILVDTTAPAVATVAVPAIGYYRAGDTLSFTVTFSENVTVAGTDSQLGLTIGSTARTADYASKTADSITYTYTVQAGDLDTDGIAVGTIALNTSTVRDAAGNTASVALTGHVPSTAGVQVDAVPPAIAGTVDVPADGRYGVGDTLTFTITFDELVAVTGNGSTLALTIGATIRQAAFVSATADSITYAYTLAAGDNDTDGIAVGAITLNGTTIRDVAGNPANLSLTGHLPGLAGVLVDTTAPAVTGNIAVPANGSYGPGSTLTFTVTFDENVTVDGTDSTLALVVGSTTRQAALATNTGNSLTYTYTVQAGDTDANGIAIGSITLGTTTIRDAAGNDANLSLAGHLPSTAGILVDTTAPGIAGFDVPADKVYSVGDALEFTVTFDEGVTVSGTDSTLALTVGTTVRSATFLASDGNSATWRYTVQAGDLDTDGIAVGAISLGTTTIRDAAGNNAAIALTGHVPDLSGVQVDAIVPVVDGQIGVPAAGTYKTGDTLTFTVTFDTDITVTGSASTLELTIGSTVRAAAFVSATADTLTYTYTVQAGDADADGIAVDGIALHGSTIRDAGGNDASLVLTGHVPALDDVLVDALAPAVTAVTLPPAGAYHAGQVLAFTVTFDEAVTVTGTDSSLALTVGSTAQSATYFSSSGSTITYHYTVQAGDTDADGIAVGALSQGTGTIRDAAGNDAVLAGTAGPTGVVIDTTAPAVAGIIDAPAAGIYTVGQHLDFTITFSEDVTVTGTGSTLGLTVGTAARSAGLLSGTANTLTYRYTVQAGDVDADGIAIGALAAGTATIRDAAGNDAVLALTGHLPSTAGITVDATVPTVSGVQVPASGTYTAGQTLSFTVQFGEDVTVTGSDARLALTIGSTVHYAQYASSVGNAVTFVYTVQAGDLDTDGIAVGALDPGTSTIRDAAGNDAALSLAGHVPATAGVLVDAVPPVFAAATVNAGRLVLTYSDTALLDAAHPPVGEAFIVLVGGTAVAVTAVAVSGPSHTVTLTLATPVTNGQAVTVAYADPTAGNDANAIQDAAGNDAASLPATAVTNNTPPVIVPPPATGNTVDGVVVTVGTVTNSDGSVSQVMTIPVVTSSRVEQVGDNDVADIPLVQDAAGASLLTAQVPVGYGLQVSGAAGPKTAGDALTDLIREIREHTSAGSPDQGQLTGGGSGFLGGLDSSTPLLVQTIVPTAAAGGGQGSLVLTGTPTVAGNPYTALVIDARALAPSATIELHDVEFAAVIGAVRVTGGTGAQNVWGDSSAQYIMLGEGDDVLHGGGGNDTVGSAGGNDRIFGDDGDDLVFGGAGNDTIDGGSGTDAVLLAGANRSDYSFRVVDGQLVTTHLHGGSDGTDVVANVELLRFTNATADTSVYGTVTRLVEALTGGAADLATLDAMTAAAAQGATLAQIAQALYDASAASAAPDDAAFIGLLYQNVFGRAADAGGLAFWNGRIDAGASRADVALAIANSPEKLAMPQADTDFNAGDVATLVRLYSSLFERAPDEAGLNFWIAAHEAGTSIAGIADAFVASAESSGLHAGLDDQQFVDALYRSALHRDAEGNEAQYWVGELAAGHADRGDVLLGFANSAEKIALTGTISTSIDTL